MPPKKGPNKKKGKAISLVHEEQPNSLRYYAVHPTCVIAEEDITELATVGQGFYSTVKVGLWTRPNKKKENVGIKCIKEEVVRDHLAEILIEANNMVKLEHDNIVKLYGICLVTRENEPCKVKLVTEYASFGSLLAVIQDKDEEYRSFFCQITKLWEFAGQIAKGMEYLHSKNLIHFDLAARNVLVVSPNKVRITDFGLARVLCHDHKKVLFEKPIAVAWCAPELFKIQPPTKGCDVWSYGVVLWEMMSFGEQPWKGLSAQQIMEQAENPGNRLPQPSACSNAIFEIMQDTWKQEPEERPSFTKIIESLDKAKPVVASAKNTYWTARPKELSFKKGTKITLIDRTDRYLCQNDKAEIGDVDEGNMNFKVAPIEFALSKPKISSPFDMRRTDKKAILEKYKTAGQFPVGVQNLVELAAKNPQEHNPVEAQTVQPSEIGGEVQYTPMDGAREDFDGSEIQSVNPYPTEPHYSVPKPIPERVDLHQPPLFKSNTLPTKKRPPVPKPRKNRPKSVQNEPEEKTPIAANRPDHRAKDQPPNKSDVKQPEADQDVENHKHQETHDEDVPPPLPKKEIDRLQTPLPGTSGLLDPRFPPASHTLPGSEFAPGAICGVLQQNDPEDSAPTKPRSTSESSVENKTACGDEINEGIVKIQSQFPEISKDACYERILEYKGDIDHILKVLQVSSFTGTTEKQASFHLGHCGWNVERTLNYILDKH